jgi:hypothetical protein
MLAALDKKKLGVASLVTVFRGLAWRDEILDRLRYFFAASDTRFRAAESVGKSRTRGSYASSSATCSMNCAARSIASLARSSGTPAPGPSS